MVFFVAQKVFTIFEINVQFPFLFCLNCLGPYLSNCCIVLGYKDMHLCVFIRFSQLEISHLGILSNFSPFAYVMCIIFLSCFYDGL